jgi:predicted nucleic acid-binding protein
VIVIDASALVDWLLRTPARGDAVAGELHADSHPQTLDLAHVEVVSAFRRKAARGELDDDRAELALADLAATPIRTHAAAPLASRIWALRGALTAYDAAYVALAEAFDVPLLTTDARLARSSGHLAKVVLAPRR